MNLLTLRDNLPSGYVQDEGFFKKFNNSLEDLRQAGVDVSAWRLSQEAAVGRAHADEFRARIEAMLRYLIEHKQKVKLEFEP